MKTKHLLRSVGLKADLSQIPVGFYCYRYLSYDEYNYSHSVKYCPHFKRNHKFRSEKITDNYCKLVKNKEPDILLSDSCKTCGIKMWSDE